MAELDIEKIVASISCQVNNDMEDFIVRVVNDYKMDSSIVVNAKKITEALEKQIPKKIAYQIGKDGLKHEKCPSCGSFRVFGKHCTECGQAVDYD